MSQDQTKFLEKFAHGAARWSGTSSAFLVTLGLTMLWVVTGPFFHFSPAWQMAMNSVSSAVTFVMVFLLQRSQIKDSIAMQIKLNEIIASLHGADNHLINIEELSEAEILSLRRNYQKLATRVQDEFGESRHVISSENEEELTF